MRQPLHPNRLLKIFCAVLFCFAIFRSSAQTDQNIYTDSLFNGWQDYGWAKIDYNNTNAVHSGSKAISVTITNNTYQAIFFHHDAFDTFAYTNLTFWINGGTNGGQRLQVQALLNGTAQPGVTLAPLATNLWQQISLSLASLGVSNKSNMDGFWIQSSIGSAQPVFYLDDIKLVAAPAPSLIHVNINAAQILRTVDARLFGLNAAVWDGNFDTTNTSARLSEMDNQALRFPGGSLSDEYHWASNTTGTNTWTWATSFDQFAHLATNLNAKVFITVNYGSGTATEATNWVRYSNITKNYGFKYWEIGNENYGTWETDTNTFAHDPFTYATRAKDYFTRMKTTDPTIKIGVVAVTGEDSYANGYTSHPATNSRTAQIHNGWTPVLLTTLKNLGVTPDFLIYHKYAQNAGLESDAALLQSSRSWADDAVNLRQQLADYLGSAGTNVELICTENNSVSSSPGKQMTSLVNALFLADSVGQILQTEFNSLFWWDIRNGRETANNNDPSLYGWRQYGDYGIFDGATNVYPNFYASKLLKYFARGGDKVIQAASDYPLLAAYATKRTNASLSLLVINKSSTTALNVTATLSGYVPHTNALVYSYGIPQDETVRTNGTLSPNLAQTNFTAAGTNFSFTFPPYSLTVFSLSPTAPRLKVFPDAARTNGQFQFQIQGEPGGRYAVQTSSNFLNWSAVVTNTLATNSLFWTDPAANSSPRFYRAVWIP
ncbi:MAG: alpha-L-arabinofuranosidase [Verrucomicrobiota bacterium]